MLNLLSPDLECRNSLRFIRELTCEISVKSMWVKKAKHIRGQAVSFEWNLLNLGPNKASKQHRAAGPMIKIALV